MTALLASTAGWTIGWSVGLAAVFAVVALVVPILLLANRIGTQAADINTSLMQSVDNTAALSELDVTKDSAEAIATGLARGRNRLGG